jgi:uncharacterized membrane protein (DUF2068 family)
VTSQRKKKQKKRTGRAGISAGVRLIAAFKLFKGLVLFAVAIGAVKLLHKNVASEVERWADMFRVDPNNHYFQHQLARFSNLNPKKLKELSVGTFFYSALLLTEGTGLLLGQRWAEYFTIIVTSSFIPIEIYELAKRVDTSRIVLLLINVAVVIYLVLELSRTRKDRSD